VTSAMRPILLNSCAKATTAEEARFRIDRPIGSRAALILALDDDAAEVVGRVAERPWGAARFMAPADQSESRLAEELADADVAIMVATADVDAGVAAVVARLCGQRGIMTAGLVLGDRLDVAEAVTALRPYARNLMITDDEEDLAEVLTALRA
jgi:hypothetical protein